MGSTTRFLGSCEVCGQTIRNYRALSAHLVKRPDSKHQALRRRWLRWREAHYQCTLLCRKCNRTWVVKDKVRKEEKRCPRCERMRQKLSKRAYEAWHPEKVSRPETLNPRKRSARWDGLAERTLTWTRGDALYQEVVAAFSSGEGVLSIRQRLGVPYPIYLQVMQDALGVEGYRQHVRKRKSEVGAANVKLAHAQWRALSPEEKAIRAKQFSRGGSSIEKKIAAQLVEAGYGPLELNTWISVQIGGQWKPREADIKIPLPDGRKVVVFCDGEAFHGPRFVFGDREERVRDDTETAQAFYDLGYSALRYSETEIRSGEAALHLLGVLDRLGASALRVFRTWHPVVEHLEHQVGSTT